MKICFFADGGSIHTIRWCTHFQKLGNEVHLITFNKVEIPNVQVHSVEVGKVNVSGGNWRVLLKFRKVKKLLAEISPDVFHSLYATSYGITGALCGFHPYVITALGTDVLISPQQSKIYKRLLRFAFSKADWITSMSDFMKKVIHEMGVANEKISTVPFGIDPEIFNDENRSVPNDAFIVTSTRNFERIYNIPHLINAIANIRNQIPNLHLNLVGSGSLKGELEALINIRQLNDQVTFFGKLKQPEIAEILNKSHVFVSVSLSDGNNISLNEAMACGAFCIATNIPANTQWIEDSVNGYLVPIDDVEDLAKKIMGAYHHYRELQSKAAPINKKIIAEKGIWSTNMKIVENHYKSLMLKK